MPVLHSFVSAIPDDPASVLAGEVVPSNWNDSHVVSIEISEIDASGTPDNTTFLRGDGSWATGSSNVSSITQNAHGFSVSDLVYLNSGTYTLAQADDVVSAEVVGMVSGVTDVNTFSLTTGGMVTGLSGLTAGTVYFLSPTSAGDLTSTEPSTVGQVVKPIFVANSTTSGYFINYRGELIAPSSNAVNLYIQDTPPVDSSPYLWIDTTGGDLNFWVEDGV